MLEAAGRAGKGEGAVVSLGLPLLAGICKAGGWGAESLQPQDMGGSPAHRR